MPGKITFQIKGIELHCTESLKILDAKTYVIGQDTFSLD
jgi:hypothetical protein